MHILMHAELIQNVNPLTADLIDAPVPRDGGSSDGSAGAQGSLGCLLLAPGSPGRPRGVEGVSCRAASLADL